MYVSMKIVIHVFFFHKYIHKQYQMYIIDVGICYFYQIFLMIYYVIIKSSLKFHVKVMN